MIAATTPVHALPWYFGAAFFVVWSGAAVGLLLLVRRRLKARAERRAEFRRQAGRGRGRGRSVPDDRSLGSGAPGP